MDLLNLELDFGCPVRKSEKPLSTENTLLMMPGPTNISPRVKLALTNSTIPSHANEENYEMFRCLDNLQKMARYVFQTNNAFTIIQQTSGNGANETMVCNLTEPGDTVVVAVSGLWAERLASHAERHRLNVIRMKTIYGNVFTLDMFEMEIQKHKPTALFVVHGETIDGHVQDLEGLGDLCHKYNCLLGVDGVITVGSMPVFFDRWKLDALVTAGQKALGACAGISLLSFSPMAQERMISKNTPPPYYLDAVPLGKYFKCFSNERSYVYTYNSHVLCALHEALAELCEEGLKNAWKRHRECAEMMWEGLEELGMNLVAKKEIRLIPVIVAKPPSDVDYKELMRHLREKYKVLVHQGVGASKGCLRIGCMGYNARPQVVTYFLEVLRESMQYVRKNKQNVH